MRTHRHTFGFTAVLGLAGAVLVGVPAAVAADPVPGRIAFASTRFPGSAEIVTMDADGSSPTRATWEQRAVARPAWSPQGDVFL